MTAATLTALAKRVEREDPSRELDAEVARAIGLPDVHWDVDQVFYATQADEDGGPWLTVPDYTSSLDAAMTLVPKGSSVQMSNTLLVSRPGTWVAQVLPRHASTAFFTFGPTPAAALTAACLRARAMQEKDDAGSLG